MSQTSFRYISIKPNCFVFIALPNDTSFALFQITRTERRIEMVQRYQFVLNVCTGPTLFRRTYQYADFTTAHPIKHILFLLVGLCAVNIRNFSRRNAKRYKFPLDVIVNVKVFQRIVILIFFFGTDISQKIICVLLSSLLSDHIL